MNNVAPQETPQAQGAPLTLEDMQSQLAAVNKELEVSKDRYTNLQSHHDKTRTGLESENRRLKKESSVFTPPKTPEELAAFKETNPDWMGVIETVAHDIASNSLKPIQEDLSKAKAEKAAAELLQAHPDALEISQTEHFQTWATAQGPDIQSWLADEHDASKVIRALNYYKAMNTSATQVPTYNEPSAADAVSTHGSVVTPQTQGNQRVFTREQIERMSQRDYAANQEEIQKQYAQGLIR